MLPLKLERSESRFSGMNWDLSIEALFSSKRPILFKFKNCVGAYVTKRNASMGFQFKINISFCVVQKKM